MVIVINIEYAILLQEHRKGEAWNSSDSTPEKIPFENLVLLELRHVAKGSYQPVFVSRTFTVNPPS